MAFVRGAVAAVEVVVETLIWARHAAVPAQRVSPLAVLVLRRPLALAVADALAVTAPVQPASGQTMLEPARPLPEIPAIGAPSVPVSPESRLVEVPASLAVTHPAAAAVQVAFVVDVPGTPEVAPVVPAVQPGPAHCAMADESATVAGAPVTGLLASAAAPVAAARACFAAVAAALAAFFCSAVAPSRAAISAACAASCSASTACCSACSAASLFCSATMSATTWPLAAVELVCARQPDSLVVHVALVPARPSGGPRAPFAPFTAIGPSLPAAEVRAVPEQATPSAQSSVALAIVQLDAPGTVGAPEFALEPGAVGAGRVAGCCSSDGCPAGGSSPVVPEVTVAFAVDRSATSGVITFASGPDEAPEFVTAWHTPPVTPSHDPSECEPRGSGDTTGSVAVPALVTLPVHGVSPAHVIAAPAADAADGPAGSRAAFTGCPSPARASAAPGPLDAVETERTSQPPVAPVHDALPSEVRGVPFATAPSHAVVLVRTEPEHVVPASHTRPAVDDAVDDGPAAA
jgi:hypothetical protein